MGYLVVLVLLVIDTAALVARKRSARPWTPTGARPRLLRPPAAAQAQHVRASGSAWLERGSESEAGPDPIGAVLASSAGVIIRGPTWKHLVKLPSTQ